jgi:diacylglycerol kinase
MKRLFISFIYAGRGFWYCVRYERHFRIHLVAAAYVLTFAPSFSLSRGEWAALLTIIVLVIATEGINTEIERAIDISAKDPHPLAQIAKDAAAGAVMFCAVISIVIAGILFYRPDELLELGLCLIETPWKLLLLAVSVPISLLFIVSGRVKDRK